MSGYTKVDNWLFDVVMPDAKPNTFKVVAAVERKTAGWGKKQDKISLSQFQDLTGIANRTTLCRAIQDALDNGYINRVKVGATYVYSTPSTETVLGGYRNSTSSGTETVPVASTETVPTKEQSVNNNIKERDIDAFADWFADNAGIFGRRNDYQDAWAKPLAHYIERGRGLDGAKLLVDRALAFARGDNETGTHYTIKNPASLSRIIANMNGTGPADKVQHADGGGVYL